MIKGDTFKFLYYKDETNAKWFALMLYGVAIRSFKKIYRVKDFKSLKEHVELAQQRQLTDEEMFSDFIINLTTEAIIDYVKLGICFENYAKGVLIEKGYLINKIDVKIHTPYLKELKEIKRKQDKEFCPIKAEDYLKYDSYSYDEEIHQNTLKNLSEKTLDYSVLLEKIEYKKILNISNATLLILNAYRKKRNSIHFLTSMVGSYDSQIISEWTSLISFVNENIIERHNQLIDELGYSINRKIDKIEGVN